MDDEKKEEMFKKVMGICYDQIKGDKNPNYSFLEDKLKENIPFKNIKANVEAEGYDLKVTLTLPKFLPAITDDNELVYVCMDEDIDLQYIESDGKYIFYSEDPEVISFLNEFKEDIKIG